MGLPIGRKANTQADHRWKAHLREKRIKKCTPAGGIEPRNRVFYAYTRHDLFFDAMHFERQLQPICNRQLVKYR